MVVHTSGGLADGKQYKLKLKLLLRKYCNNFKDIAAMSSIDVKSFVLIFAILQEEIETKYIH